MRAASDDSHRAALDSPVYPSPDATPFAASAPSRRSFSSLDFRGVPSPSLGHEAALRPRLAGEHALGRASPVLPAGESRPETAAGRGAWRLTRRSRRLAGAAASVAEPGR